jgi:hypothetical protein
MLKQLDFVSDLENAKSEKKTRIIIVVFLALTLIPSFIFWTIAKWRENPPAVVNPLKKVNIPEVNFSEKDIYSLKPKLDKWAEENIVSLPGQWSVKISFLKNNFSWQRYSTKKMKAASLIKLPVVAAFYHQVEEGEFALDDELNGSTMGQLASKALSHSDNDAWQALQEKIGRAKINSLMLIWGMTETSLEDNTTTAEDVSLFFTKLYQGEILSEEYKNKMLNDLTNTIYEEQIPAGVPEGIRVAHKVGYLKDVVSDAGIIYFPNNPYVLVIMSDQTNPIVAKQKFPTVVENLYWLIADNI